MTIFDNTPAAIKHIKLPHPTTAATARARIPVAATPVVAMLVLACDGQRRDLIQVDTLRLMLGGWEAQTPLFGIPVPETIWLDEESGDVILDASKLMDGPYAITGIPDRDRGENMSFYFSVGKGLVTRQHFERIAPANGRGMNFQAKPVLSSPSGEEAKKIRIEAGITQDVAAKIAGVSLRTWSRYENGGRLQDHAWGAFVDGMPRAMSSKTPRLRT